MAIARVLVVDDDAAVRRMLVDYLGAHDYAVDVAANGTELRQYFEQQTPDVVLLDVGLPGEDGLSLARYLRERYAVGVHHGDWRGRRGRSRRRTRGGCR